MPRTPLHSCGSIRCVLVPFPLCLLLKTFSQCRLYETVLGIDENGSIDESAIPAGRTVVMQPDSAASRRGKACLERYRRASAQIFTIFQRMFPQSVLEKASIDEAYLGEPLHHPYFGHGKITEDEALLLLLNQPNAIHVFSCVHLQTLQMPCPQRLTRILHGNA